MKKVKHKKTYYNDIALRLVQKLFNLEFLHYGYFEKGLKVNLENLPKAQLAFTKKVIREFPKNVKNVLDIGCGAGGGALEMIKKNMTITCVDPDPFMVQTTLKKTKYRVNGKVGLYENLEDLPKNHFDLIMMCESCQYINPDTAWPKHASLVKEKGYVMAVDFFKIRKLDHIYLSRSGHELERFIKIATMNKFKLIKKINITKQTAPTMDLYQSIILEKVFPVFEAVFCFLERSFPLLYKIGNFLLKKKISYLHLKYSNQDSKVFTKYKQYYILLFQKN